MKMRCMSVSLGMIGLLLCGPTLTFAQDSFYKGKTIRIIVGTSAGGGFDTYTRTLARHFGKHVPGQPAIVVENMPGAGHLIAANHMYNVAKPDGLTIGHFHGGWFLYQLFKRPGIEFDATKYELIGSPIRESRACAFTKASGITSVERWLASKTPVKVGGIGGGAPDDMARMLAATTALPIQLVAGYKGTSEIRLAAESGELAGGCWTWDSIRSTWSKAIKSGEAIVVLQAVAKPHRDLPHVPLAQSLAKTEEARQLLQAGVQDPADFYRPYLAPPRTPKQHVEILRQAFNATMKDSEFLADAKKASLEIEPITGQEMERLIAGIFKLDAAMAAKLKSILNPS
ncbi:MAG TPA: tripartite tricarboxylate transporter substrate-binding protein [Candidatus Binatia bacterium]|nr:tripartite tricarboxylate transporter substrate-binding protein [Candidatus Binatia bacterium]